MNINNIVTSVNDSAMSTAIKGRIIYDNIALKINSYIDNKYEPILPKNKFARGAVNFAIIIIPGSFTLLGTYAVVSDAYKIIKKAF